MRSPVPIFVVAALAVSTPALALDPPAVAKVAPAGSGQGEATLLFAGGAVAEALPARVDATIRESGRDSPVTLVLVDRGDVPARGFGKARYRFPVPARASGDLVLLLPGGSAFAFAAPSGTQPRYAEAAPAAAPPPASDGLGGDRPRAGNPFLANLSSFNPVYAAFGHGTNSDGKIQISLKYQLFGRADAPTGDWKEGFRFGYTQRMLWDVGGKSAPFRDVNYQPELFYTHELALGGVPLNLRGGVLHESNGRSGDASRAYNIVYVQPSTDVPLGAWTLSVGPRFYQYILGRDGNEDIARYRGHQALALAIGQDDGIKLSTWSRVNFGTGKGSVEGELSYPLDRLIGAPLYVMAQGFRGYGEDLLDYDRRQTRLRLGIAIVR